jgi:parvulin-like peptidyl-prolyl isomerase
MKQLLEQNRLTQPEFDLVIEANAYLRKIAEPRLKGKISEENVKEAFLQQYGETVKVRHIQLTNLQEIAEAQRRISTGEPFEKVAREMSRNRSTAPVGGELPAFSINMPGLPQSFKEAAFALQPGQISDPVQAEGAYHLIRLEERIAPKAVKYDDHKEIVRADLQDRLTQAAVKELRQQLGQQALKQLRIENPALRAQFEARKQEREAQIKDRAEFKKQLEEQRRNLATQPIPDWTTTAPSEMDTNLLPEPPAPPGDAAPSTQPAPAP